MKTQHQAKNSNAQSAVVRTQTPSILYAGTSRTGKTSLLRRALCLGLWLATMAPAFAQSGVLFTRITAGDLVTDVTVTAEAAALDYDNDGDLDLFTANEIGQNNNLYRNDGGGVFTRIASVKKAESEGTGRRRPGFEDAAPEPIVEVGSLISDGGDSEAVTAVDYDNDGDLDLFVSNNGPNFLYRNQGDGTFERVLDSPLATETANSSASAWADLDHDGWLDVFNVNRYTRDTFFWGRDGGDFTRADESHPLMRITHSEEYSALWWDYDNDSDLDLYIPTRFVPNALFRNDANGIFERLSGDSPLLVGSVQGNSLSANSGDHDNDGDLDLLVANFDGIDELLINRGNGHFERTAQMPGGINDGPTGSAGAMWGDYDNDGFLDLIIGMHFNERNRLFRNSGDGTLTEVTDSPVASDYGSAQGVLWFDYDNDGFLDLYVSNSVESSTSERDSLYHNEGNENHWLKVDLQGTVSNRSGVGAKIEVITQIRGETLLQLREISTRGGWSGSGLQAHFGLGDATIVEFILVWWPSGIVQEIHDVPADQTLVIVESSGEQTP